MVKNGWFHLNKLIGREGPFAGPEFSSDKEKVFFFLEIKIKFLDTKIFNRRL